MQSAHICRFCHHRLRQVFDAYWAIFGTEDLTTGPGPELVKIIDARIDAFAAKYQAIYPAAVKILLTDREGLTAYLRFPAEHHNRIRPGLGDVAV